jgi:hypothetical protein
MALSASARAAFAVAFCLPVALWGCAQGNGDTTGVAVSFDPGSTAARFRSGGARETTLADFCKNPPKAPNPEAAEAIRASCLRIVLDKVGDAALFDKGDGLYHVVFKRPVRNGDICRKGTAPQSICGNFAEGDKMHTSRINGT